MSRPLAVICLAAGLGKRTKVSLPKVLLPLCGRTLVASALAAVAPLQPQRTVVVLSHQKEKVQKAVQEACGGMFARLEFVDQGAPRGTLKCRSRTAWHCTDRLEGHLGCVTALVFCPHQQQLWSEQMW